MHKNEEQHCGSILFLKREEKIIDLETYVVSLCCVWVSNVFQNTLMISCIMSVT